MSGGANCKWRLAPQKECFKPYLMRLHESFESYSDIIYKSRNILAAVNWEGERVIVKSFGTPNLFNRYLYRWVRKSKACRALENAVELTKRGINTPDPIGYIEYHRWNSLTRSFYAYHEWPAASTAREFITNPDQPNRTKVLNALGEFAWQLHDRGVDFRDFSPGNILVKWSQKIEFCLVDINRIVFQMLPLDKRMMTFARLWAGNHELSIIVSGYTACSRDDNAEALKLALHYSQLHKNRSLRKEGIKTLLRLH